MTYERAIAFADRVIEMQDFAKPDAPKKVEVLGVMNKIAALKVTVWWGVDYVLLVKDGDKWMIEQVLWASLPEQQPNHVRGMKGMKRTSSKTMIAQIIKPSY